MKNVIEDVLGAVLLLLIWITLMGLASLADAAQAPTEVTCEECAPFAAGAGFAVEKGDTFAVHACEKLAAVVLKPGQSVQVNCASSPTPEPTPTPTPTPTPPPSGACPGPSHDHVFSSTVRPLRIEELKFSINPHGAVAWQFTPRQLWSNISFEKRFTYVPHAHGTGSSTQSKTHTLSFSECKGDFRGTIPFCTQNGSEGSIRVSTSPQAGRCVLNPNKTYYLNVIARTPAPNMRPAAGGGILVKVPR